MKNIAFIDGQNLHMGTKTGSSPWSIDFMKIRTYLKEKYNVDETYYYLGFCHNKHQDLYDNIQKAGMILKFKEHSNVMSGKKKGNVDSDIVFTIMKKLYKKEKFGKVIIVSEDGDYKLLIDFLIRENKFEKILFPNKKFASSLYKEIGSEFYDYLENPATKRKIIYTNKKGSLGI